MAEDMLKDVKGLGDYKGLDLSGIKSIPEEAKPIIPEQTIAKIKDVMGWKVGL